MKSFKPYHKEMRLKYRLLVTISLIIIIIFGLWYYTIHVRKEKPVIRETEPPVAIDTTPSVELTSEEIAFLQELGSIKMVVDPDWEPYELVTEDGEFIGIAADLLD